MRVEDRYDTDIHAEHLAAYLAGRERSDSEARWDDLVPPYQDLAANIGWALAAAGEERARASSPGLGDLGRARRFPPTPPAERLRHAVILDSAR